MKISISKKLIMRLIADRISDISYINWIVDEYIRSAESEIHIIALAGRDCYFYPTARQRPQWVDCVGTNREILGNVALVHDGLMLAHEFLPEVIKEDTDLASIAILPFETSSLFMVYDDLEFYKRIDASLLKTGELQK